MRWFAAPGVNPPPTEGPSAPCMHLSVGNFSRYNLPPMLAVFAGSRRDGARAFDGASTRANGQRLYALEWLCALEGTELRFKRLLDFGLMALLLAGAAVQTGWGNTAEPPINARKYWDRPSARPWMRSMRARSDLLDCAANS